MNGASTRSRRSPGFSGAHLRPATRLAARRAALIADESERFFSLPPTLRSRLVGQQIRSAFRNSDMAARADANTGHGRQDKLRVRAILEDGYLSVSVDMYDSDDYKRFRRLSLRKLGAQQMRSGGLRPLLLRGTVRGEKENLVSEVWANQRRS